MKKKKKDTEVKKNVWFGDLYNTHTPTDTDLCNTHVHSLIAENVIKREG